ncbi:conserved Plasmodium protein, unknown function [Plasmodium ovale]|uniref:Uncharacterized protein n=1 Tax=Plasmodium ovale TaxID=36330 RepID=A0A1D3TKP4_PLAOA|nr:conserved Plasmodium protein, unknown function [Plasmodium ovale]
MSENKKTTLPEKRNEEMATILNKNLFFKEYNNGNDLRDTFVNVKTDNSLDSEKEKSNISLFHIFKKKLKEENYCSRFLIIFKISNFDNDKKDIQENVKKVLAERYNTIKGVCLLISIYAVMLLECPNTKHICYFLKWMARFKKISDIEILYFSELNKTMINDQFHFYEYNKEEPKGTLSGDCSCADEVWDLYVNVLNLCCLVKNNEDKQNMFDKNENIKKNFSLLPNFYKFVSFFMDDFRLADDDFSDDFLDF